MPRKRNPKAPHRKLRKYPYEPYAHDIAKGVPFVELEYPGREETQKAVYIANPLDLPEGRYPDKDVLFLFSFGAYGDTFVAVWDNHLEDALEEVGGFLVEYLPGHITQHDDPHLKELYEEAKEEGDEDSWDADLTYTESGYLTSYEWSVDEFGPGDPFYDKVWRKSADVYRKQYGEMPEAPEYPKPRKKRKNPSARQLKAFLSR
jgi:hypothetical protein